MLTHEQKIQELSDRALALKTSGKLKASDYAQIINVLIPRIEAWLSQDYSSPLQGRLAYLNGKANSFQDNPTPSNTVNFRQRYRELIQELETNPQPEIEAMKIGLYVKSILDESDVEDE